MKDKLEGFGWFTYETVKRIVRNHPEHEFIFFFDRKFDTEFIFAENVTPVVLSPQARHPILFDIWFNYSVTRALKKHKIDVFLSPDGYLSLRTNVPQVGVIHDLNFEHYPDDLPKNILKYYKTRFPKFANKANRLATVSNFSKDDIVKQYGIKPEKIDVVHNGVNAKFHAVDDTVKSKIREKFTGGKPYFIYVGSLHPRKNITRLLQAFDVFKKEDTTDVQLMIVGEKYWWNEEMETSFQQLAHKNEVHFVGHVQNDELNAVIASALAMTYVSYFEGFGIPALEAMKCEVPLIAANATSLPEVVGNAGILVDPFSVVEISAAMNEIASDIGLREELIIKGSVQVVKFNWDKTAEGLWNTILKCIN